jgi:hypothetical protein
MLVLTPEMNALDATDWGNLNAEPAMPPDRQATGLLALGSREC